MKAQTSGLVFSVFLQRQHQGHGLGGRSGEAEPLVEGFGFFRDRMHQQPANAKNFCGLRSADNGILQKRNA
jgi:hypothetical protein